jgi:NDP-sugar pyrophosphorylase family protein
MTIVIPMAGHGSRFSQAGFKIPKPLIPIDGVPMFVRAANSLPLQSASQIVFVVLKEHIRQLHIDKAISEAYPSLPISIVALNQVTKGQAETVAIALEQINATGSLLIFNSDSAFESNLVFQLENLPIGVAGAIQYFSDDNSRWSFIRLNSYGHVVETAEKRVISNMASTGLYYFSSAKEFLENVDASNIENGEMYVAPVYNKLLQQGKMVTALPVQRYFCFGTPEDLDRHQSGHYYTVYGN